MKFTVSQTALKQALSKVSKVVATRSALPVLSNIKLSANEGVLTIEATNLEIGMRDVIACQIDAPGATTINARLFADFVNQVNGDVTMEQVKADLKITSGGQKATMRTIDAEDFPLIPDIDDNLPRLQLKASLIADMVGHVEYCAASNDSRQILTGISFTIADGAVTMAAADGFRLAVDSVGYQTDNIQPVSLIIPAISARELARLCAGHDGDIDAQVNNVKTQILFRVGSTLLISQLIAGKFPDYRQIIPMANETAVTVETAELLQAVRTANIFARDAANIMRFEAIPGRLIISSNAAELGDARTEIECQVTGDDDVEVAFNAKFVMDVLAANAWGKTVIRLKDSKTPGIFESPADEDSWISVIMPMNMK